MENKNAEEFENLLKGYKYIKLRMIQQSAGIALAFFKASFTNQGFTDQGLTKWKNRVPGTPNDQGRAIEVKRGILKRGLRIKRADINGAIVGMDEGIPYAEIQNFGGQIPITPKMRRFFWAMYYQAGGGKGKSLSANAQFYFNLAITKEQFLTVPKRQFIGDSVTLEKDIRDYITTELNKFFKIE